MKGIFPLEDKKDFGSNVTKNKKKLSGVFGVGIEECGVGGVFDVTQCVSFLAPILFLFTPEYMHLP